MSLCGNIVKYQHTVGVSANKEKFIECRHQDGCNIMKSARKIVLTGKKRILVTQGGNFIGSGGLTLSLNPMDNAKSSPKCE